MMDRTFEEALMDLLDDYVPRTDIEEVIDALALRLEALRDEFLAALRE